MRQGKNKLIERLPHLLNHVQQSFVTALKPGFPRGRVLFQLLHFLSRLQKLEHFKINPKEFIYQRSYWLHVWCQEKPFCYRLLEHTQVLGEGVKSQWARSRFVPEASRLAVSKYIRTGANSGKRRLLRATLFCQGGGVLSFKIKSKP